MSWINKAAAAWRGDQVLGRVVRNSGLLFASNMIGAILSIVTANMLGVQQFGLLGIIMSFVSNVNRLLSFRMGDFIVRYVGDALAQGEKQKASALVKVAGLTEAFTSIFAYLVLILLAPLGARYIIHDLGATPIVLLYGLSILGMLTTETATGILQIGNHYRSQSLINLLQAVVTALLIVYAAVTHSGVWIVALAYLAGKLVAGIGPMLLAAKRLDEMFGKRWWKTPLSALPPTREMVKFGLSTNFSGTINMVVRDSELLWVGWLFNAEVAGYFKVALAMINLVIMPINPFIATTYPEITRAISLKLWEPLKKLLRRVSLIAGGWTIAIAVGLSLLGNQILFTAWIPWKGHLSSIYKLGISACPAIDTDPIGGLRNREYFFLESVFTTRLWVSRISIESIFDRDDHQSDPHHYIGTAIWIFPGSLVVITLPGRHRRCDSGAGIAQDEAGRKGQPMKIACISTSQVPSTTANSIQVMKVCQQMKISGHEVKLWVPGNGRLTFDQISSQYGLHTPFEITWTPAWNRLKRYDFAFSSVMEALYWMPDLVYTWTPQVGVLATWRRKATVLEMHDRATGRFGPKILKNFIQSPRSNHELVCVTRALKNALEKQLEISIPEHLVVIAPNGVDVERYQNLPDRQTARKKLGLAENVTVSYTGHFYAGRGVDVLFALAKAFPQVQFLWIGGRERELSGVRDTLNQNHLTNVHLTGFLDNQILPLYQAASDVLLMPYEKAIAGSSGGNSVDICSPMKMFEYMAVGRPMITSDLPVIQRS